VRGEGVRGWGEEQNNTTARKPGRLQIILYTLGRPNVYGVQEKEYIDFEHGKKEEKNLKNTGEKDRIKYVCEFYK
jgi:hypothetical protein